MAYGLREFILLKSNKILFFTAIAIVPITSSFTIKLSDMGKGQLVLTVFKTHTSKPDKLQKVDGKEYLSSKVQFNNPFKYHWSKWNDTY